MTPLCPELSEALSASESYRTSIRHVTPASVNYSSVARNARLKSRAFVREVLRGEKIPSLEVLQSILKAIAAPPAARRIVLLQWKLERDPPHAEATQLAKLLIKARRKLNVQTQVLRSDDLYRAELGPIVFAALGSPNVGAAVSEIRNKTRLKEADIERTLAALERDGLIRRDPSDHRAYPTSDHLTYPGMGGADGYRRFFLAAVRSVRIHAQSQFEEKENLFSAHTLCIRRDRMKEYADRLWELNLAFVREVDDPEGDTVVSLQVGFHATESAKMSATESPVTT